MTKRKKQDLEAFDEEKLTENPFCLLRIRLKSNYPQAKVISVLSYLKGEGKSYIANKLASSMSQQGDKVVLLDANFKNKTCSQDSKNKLSFSNYLRDECEIQEILETSKSYDVINNYEAIENSTILLESKKYRDLIAYLKEEYDFILIDTSAIRESVDALTIGKKSDGVIMVVESNRINLEDMIEQRELFSELNIKVLGSMLNKYRL